MLPIELLVRVFLFLDYADIGLGVFLVCQHWFSVANDSIEVWTKFLKEIDSTHPIPPQNEDPTAAAVVR